MIKGDTGVEQVDRVPVVYSTIASQALVAVLRAGYRMDEPMHCSLWNKDSNDHYLVTAGVRKYMLRVYAPGKSWIRSPSDLQTYLHTRNVPLAVPIQRRDGDLIATIQAPEGVVLTRIENSRRSHMPPGTGDDKQLQPRSCHPSHQPVCSEEEPCDPYA